MSILVGLTGGMGSGKSLAASYFKEQGACIIDADLISRQLVEPGQPAWKEIVDEFGKEYFNDDQSLNRAKIASEVFRNDEKRSILEGILHHRIIAEEKKIYHSYHKIDSKAVVIVDAALLIESGNYKNMDRIVIVQCTEELQIRRVMECSKTPHADVKNRLKSQMPLKEKLKYADYILYNESNRDQLKSRVCRLYSELKNLA